MFLPGIIGVGNSTDVVGGLAVDGLLVVVVVVVVVGKGPNHWINNQ